MLAGVHTQIGTFTQLNKDLFSFRHNSTIIQINERQFRRYDAVWKIPRKTCVILMILYSILRQRGYVTDCKTGMPNKLPKICPVPLNPLNYTLLEDYADPNFSKIMETFIPENRKIPSETFHLPGLKFIPLKGFLIIVQREI